ncbi:signal protein [Streptomyces sp. Act143]|uniref:signal protein n=1 Tax=Streptomyces sp. Act143 TaxID=2200760 RepID=UPI000D68436F|nr:signal protein [Streptomyces sp. Act143]PWI16585.1 signal protein [Streptomyces sp. Act143]
MKVRGGGRTGLVSVALAAVLVGCGGGDGGEEAAEAPDSASASASAPVSASASPSTSASASVRGRLAPDVLQSRWWSWAASEPEATNPVADEDGGDCARNQPEDVWFLAGTFGTRARRSCPVPAGVPVAFPLVNRIGGPADCAAFMDGVEGSAVLDGKEVEAESYRGQAVTVESVAGNPVTGTDETFQGTGCGLWVQLPALESGSHTLRIRGRAGDFATGVDYTLAVTAAS